ncbi:hypothetical protein [Mesorhizobium sp. L-8-3]|uniref:hypothetical protein n=1 Tax=Mesorhizobium sp. L-8-3 TaxID=2744522 RepID=UPI001926DEBB|nr:hypothetical protein [Mesorhizobium sp. L-8-3]BCH27252.1 hypothetical protein MesoLjLb_70370 [Mesorhizobium sp. L-8-3]
MKRGIRIFAWALGLLVVAGLGFFFFVLPAQVEAAMNGVLQPPPYATSDKAKTSPRQNHSSGNPARRPGSNGRSRGARLDGVMSADTSG